MEKIDEKIYKRLESLTKERIFEVLTKAGIKFPNAKQEELTKEELLLVADEADMDILKKELNNHKL